MIIVVPKCPVWFVEFFAGKKGKEFSYQKNFVLRTISNIDSLFYDFILFKILNLMMSIKKKRREMFRL
jgi:hypothetical protein